MKQNLKFLFPWTNEERDHLLVISSEGAGTGGLHFCKGTVNAGKHMQVLEQHTRPSKHLVCWTEVSADLSSTEHIWWVMKQDVQLSSLNATSNTAQMILSLLKT